MSGSRVLALVAAKDRADTVGATVTALRSFDEVDEVLVVDDGSSDRTAQEAADAGAWVLRLPENVGKGGAVAAGVAASPETDVYLLVDADLGSSAGAVAPLLEPVLSDRADLAIGVPPAAGTKGGFGLVKRLAGAGIHRACGFTASAPISGQRAVRGELLRSLELADRFGLEAGFTIDSVRAGARVVEVPVDIDHHHTGRSLAGFAHRGRQGADIVRALWSRLTSSRARLSLVVMTLVMTLLAITWSGSQWEADSVATTREAEKVLIVGIPGLGWDDLGSGAMPKLDELIDTGAVAAMSVRTGSTPPAVAEGYATLGAGSRVRVRGANRGAAAAVAETPDPDGGRSILVSSIDDLREDAGRHLSTGPGDLGEALHEAGLRTAVIGVADIPSGLSVPATPLRRPAQFRPAALALMDSEGRVDEGLINEQDVLERHGPAPFGQRADADAVVSATQRAIEEADVVLVDTGDLTRVEALEEIAPESFADLARDDAIADTDDILGRLVAGASNDTLLLVVSVVPPDREWRLTPVVAAGAGVTKGRLHSPSTKRSGLVTLTDVAPTVLDALGAQVPIEMIGHPMRYSSAAADLGALERLDRDAAYRERVYFRVAQAFVLGHALLYGLALLVLSPHRWPAPATTTGSDGSGAARGRISGWSGAGALIRRSLAQGSRVVRFGVIAFAAFPLATFLFRGVPFAPSFGFAGVALLVVIDLAIVALAMRSRRHSLSALSWVMGLTVLVLVVDVATGARLQTASLLGYSPHTAARFYGLGNSAFAVFAGATILAAALHLEHAPRRKEAVVTVAAIFAVVLYVHASPTLGDDVGGILTLAPVFALMMVAIAGRRITWRTVAAAAGVTLVVLSLAAGIDLMRPPEARTHLGRVVSDTLEGSTGLGSTIARKAEANLRVLRATIWAWVVPVVSTFVVGLLAWRMRLGDLLPSGSGRRIGVVAAVSAGVLGLAVNDSGIVITALVLVFVAPVLTLLALDDEQPPPARVLMEPAGGEPETGPGRNVVPTATS